MNLAADLFQPGVPILEKVVRPILVYLFLIIALRLSGKRELAQINTFDLVVLLTLSNTVQNAIIGNDNSLIGGMVGAGTLLVMNFLVVRFLYGHPTLTRLMEGDRDVLIEQGRVMQARLKSEGITLNELEAAARRQGFETLDDVEQATLEASGALCFTGKKPNEDTLRHKALLKKIEQLSLEIKLLHQQLSNRMDE